MSVKSVFKSRMPSMSYVFSNGKYAHFIEGVYMTDIESEIAEIQKEIRSGNPFLYVDENETTFDSSLQDKINEAVANAKLAVLKSHTASQTATAAQVQTLAAQTQTEAKPAAVVNLATLVKP